MKKTIIIIIIILGIVAMILGIYFAWKKSRQVLVPPIFNQQATTDNLQSTTNNQQPTTGSQQRLKIISDQPVFDYWIATQTNADKTQTNAEIFYLNQEGKIFKVKENADDEVVSSEPIENLQMIKSSFDGKWVVIKSGDMKSPKFTLFNSENKIFELLSQDITAVDFSPDALKIAYLEKSGSNSAMSNLVIKDLVGSKPKTTKILSFNQKDFDLSWILADKIVLIPKPSAFYQAAAWSVDIVKKRIDSMNSKNGLMINWSRSGKVGLEFSTQPERRANRLNLINEQGIPRAVLDFVTLPDKCFISEPKIYCAVPEDIPVRTILPDDYLKKAVYFRDDFYQVDIDQNSMTEIFIETEPAIDATHLNLVDNKLLFINRYDSRLYQLEL